jgi:hypothetical protein
MLATGLVFGQKAVCSGNSALLGIREALPLGA